MQKAKVKCPKCGQTFIVTNKNDLPQVKIQCPACKGSLTLQFSAQASPGPNHQAENYDPNKTETGGDPKKYRIGHIVYGGREYPLKLGKNIVGRKAQSSSASIQIACNDMYMSRAHAAIDVTRLNNGMVKTVISNFKNKNSTTVNGQTVMEEDRMVLEDGSEIQMGKTVMKFIVPNKFDESNT